MGVMICNVSRNVGSCEEPVVVLLDDIGASKGDLYAADNRAAAVNGGEPT